MALREVCRAGTEWPAQWVRAASVGNSGRLAIRKGLRAQACVRIVRDITAWHSREPLLLTYFCNVTSAPAGAKKNLPPSLPGARFRPSPVAPRPARATRLRSCRLTAARWADGGNPQQALQIA